METESTWQRALRYLGFVGPRRPWYSTRGPKWLPWVCAVLPVTWVVPQLPHWKGAASVFLVVTGTLISAMYVAISVAQWRARRRGEV